MAIQIPPTRSDIGAIIAPLLGKIKLRFQSKTTMNIIGPNVKRLREAQGLTQEDLAARCNLIKWDISRGTLAKIESQVRRVTDDEVQLLAKVLKVNINELYE